MMEPTGFVDAWFSRATTWPNLASRRDPGEEAEAVEDMVGEHRVEERRVEEQAGAQVGREVVKAEVAALEAELAKVALGEAARAAVVAAGPAAEEEALHQRIFIRTTTTIR